MVSKALLSKIAEKHGAYASWAVWREQGEKPKSGMGDISIFNEEYILSLLQPNIIMVGLNLSRFTITEPFRNFHDQSSHAHDYKIRYAFRKTEYYGAYMTDIIKGVVEVDSKNIPKHLSQNPDVLQDSLSKLREEILDLGISAPLLLAFGHLAFKILKEHLLPKEYKKLIRLTHYSHQIGKEDYREKVLEEIKVGL